jgi:FlaA1/EpsC-like NDP-sugar epimerase
LGLKLGYFYELDRDWDRPLVLWGAGRNGKDMAKLLATREKSFHWVCDNENKIGKDIYGVRLGHYDLIPSISTAQIIIVVSTPAAKREISEKLTLWGKNPIADYWFFL